MLYMLSTMQQNGSLRVAICVCAGASHSDETGRIIRRWLWNPKKQGAGTPPSEAIAFPLNAWLSFEYKDRCGRCVELFERGVMLPHGLPHHRTNIKVSFSCDGIRRDLQCGLVVRRTDSYLDKCVRARPCESCSCS